MYVWMEGGGGGQFRTKTTRYPQNFLTYMLDFIEMQMNRVNCEKGYLTRSLDQHNVQRRKL